MSTSCDEISVCKKCTSDIMQRDICIKYNIEFQFKRPLECFSVNTIKVENDFKWK